MSKIIPDEQYDEALARIEKIMDAKPGTPEMDELETLTALVETYEEKHYPMTNPGPAEHVVIFARLEAVERQLKRLLETPDEQRQTIKRLETELIYERERAAKLQCAQDRISKTALQSWGYARDAIDAIRGGHANTAIGILQQVARP